MYLEDLLEPKTTGDVGRFGRVIEACKQHGTQPPGIYYLFAARPEATPHLCNFVHEVMRGPSDLSAGQRELIAAMVSARNDCVFWTSAHAAVAAHLLEDQALVDAVCADFESAPLSEKDKALFRYVARVNDAPARVAQTDVDAAKAAGWSDHALFDAATVCAVFNFFNRWIDAAGVPDVPAGFYDERLAANGDVGYAM